MSDKKEIVKQDEVFIDINPEIVLTVDQADRSDWTYDIYISTGMQIGQSNTYTQWVLGKLAHEVGKKWGSIEDYANKIGVRLSSLYNYKATFQGFLEKYPNYVPDGRFPFYLLQEAARTDNPEETLEEFENEDIRSVDAARRHVIKKKTGEERPRKPRIGLTWNPELKQWDIMFDDKDIPNINWLGVKDKLTKYFISKNP